MTFIEAVNRSWTRNAPDCCLSVSRMPPICFFRRSAQPATTSFGLSVRSPDWRGSPIRPVAPPTNAIGWCPAALQVAAC